MSASGVGGRIPRTPGVPLREPLRTVFQTQEQSWNCCTVALPATSQETPRDQSNMLGFVPSEIQSHWRLWLLSEKWTGRKQAQDRWDTEVSLIVQVLHGVF